eukprot:UN02348
MMKELQVHSESRATDATDATYSTVESDIHSIDPVLHAWFKMKCKFDEDECVRYVDIFKANGFDCIDSIRTINDCDLIHVGIQLRNRKIILSNITHLIFTMIKQSK